MINSAYNRLREFSPPSDSMAVGYWCAEEAYLGEPGVDDGEVPVWREELGSELEACPVMGEQLTTEQKEELAGVLKEFEGVFSDLPGWTSLAEHPIECGSARPIRLAPYRIPHAYRKAVQQEISEMLEEGVIEPSASEWCSPMVIVQKKDKALRICVDYRKLNSVSQVDAYPMPRIDDILDHLGKSQYISTMDLTRGYWQFKMMPFGLQGAPATFQRLMDQVIQGMDSFASAYLDELIIFSSSWEDHMRHLHCVLEQLVGAGLTVKSSKCQFGMSKYEDTGASIPWFDGELPTIHPKLLSSGSTSNGADKEDGTHHSYLDPKTDASEYGVGAVLSQRDEAGGGVVITLLLTSAGSHSLEKVGLSNGNADALSRVNMGTDQDRATKEFVAEEGGWSVKEQRKRSREKIKHRVDTKTSCPPS
ncbi:hypothetical protein EMCRGX_G001465 [Ephydatia muelleri]